MTEPTLSTADALARLIVGALPALGVTNPDIRAAQEALAATPPALDVERLRQLSVRLWQIGRNEQGICRFCYVPRQSPHDGDCIVIEAHDATHPGHGPHPKPWEDNEAALGEEPHGQ